MCTSFPSLQTYDIACWDGSEPTGGGNVVAAATPELLEQAPALVNAS